MKNIGFFGVALATTFTGDVTVLFGAGLETVSGKSLAPFFQGAVAWSSAVGAGRLLWLGFWKGHVICSGGIEG